jgi:hypothetical protein
LCKALALDVFSASAEYVQALSEHCSNKAKLMATSSTRSAICKAQQFNYALNLNRPKHESHQQYSAAYGDRDLLNRTPFSAHSTLLPNEESPLTLFSFT